MVSMIPQKKTIVDNTPSDAERGQSLVELAISMVILLTLVGGIVDLGRAMYTTMILRDAVQEGAVYASTDPSNTTRIKEHVLASSTMVRDMIGSDDITIAVIGIPCAGFQIRVTVDYSDFQITMPFIGAIVGGQTVNLSATVTTRILRPVCS